jgi:hypothetical protein
MISKEMSYTKSQLIGVIRDMVNTIYNTNTRRVTWHPKGISTVATFEIEPWRKLSRKPVSLIKEYDSFAASPFRLPDKATHLEPYFDYRTYEERSINNIQSGLHKKETLACVPIYPITSVYCETPINWLDDDDDDDDDGKGFGSSYVKTSSLCDVYEMIKDIEDYEKFLELSE